MYIESSTESTHLHLLSVKRIHEPHTLKKNVQYFSKLIIMHLIHFIKKTEYDLHVHRADFIGYGNQ